MNKRIKLVTVVLIFSAITAGAGVLYTDNELKAAGGVWKKIKQSWTAEQATHTRRMDRINSSKSLTPAQKQQLRVRENARFRKRSKALAIKRDRVQQVMMKEANARVRSGNTAVSAEVKETLGTKVDDPAHQGMKGDLDTGAGSRTTEKMKEVLDDMGMMDTARVETTPDGRTYYDADGNVLVKETPSTFEIGDDFEFCANKTGIKAKPGSEFHKVEIEVNAKNKETYVSQSMDDVPDGKGGTRKQVGKDYTAVQDHKKKAMDGLTSSGDDLVAPDGQSKMKGMAKGTNKTIVDADIRDDQLNAIMKKNQIEGSPSEFRKKLDNIKQGSTTVSDPIEAEKLRKASKDVFDLAEKQTLHEAKKNVADVKKQITELDAAGTPESKTKAQQLRDELADSAAKMKTTKKVNDASYAKKTGTPDVDVDGPKTTRPNVDVDGPNVPKTGSPKTSVKAKAMKVVKAVGVVTTVSDIGNACETIEKYRNGEIPLEDAAVTLLDSSVTMGMIGTGKKIYNSADDYTAAKKLIINANRHNVANYWQQWEIQLMKSGMSKQQARDMVGEAMLSGDTSELDGVATDATLDGKQFNRPELIVYSSDIEADDTAWERTGQVVEGMGMGIFNGTKYIVTAPSRVVNSWADMETEIADLELQTADQEAWMKGKIFKRLKSVGIDSKEALTAIHSFYDGTDVKTLRRMFDYAKEEIRKRKGYVNVKKHQKDWYCTNRPEISARTEVPDIVHKK